MPRYFEDLEVGDGFESPGRTITEADVVSYAAISGEQDCLDFTAGEDGLPPLVPDLLIMVMSSGPGLPGPGRDAAGPRLHGVRSATCACPSGSVTPSGAASASRGSGP